MSTSTIPIEDVLDILKTHLRGEDTKIQSIAKDLIAAQKEIAADKKAEAAAKGPKLKNRFAVLIRSDDPKLKDLVNAGAWIVAVPDDSTTNTYMGQALIDRLAKAATTSNESVKRKRSQRQLKTFVQVMEQLKTKAIKASGSTISIKTRYPAEVIVVDKENLV